MSAWLLACAWAACAGGAWAGARAPPSDLRFDGAGLVWRPSAGALAVPAAWRLSFRTSAGAVTEAVMLVRDVATNRRLCSAELGPEDGAVELGAAAASSLFAVSLRLEQLYAAAADGGNATFWDAVFLPLGVGGGATPLPT